MHVSIYWLYDLQLLNILNVISSIFVIVVGHDSMYVVGSLDSMHSTISNRFKLIKRRFCLFSVQQICLKWIRCYWITCLLMSPGWQFYRWTSFVHLRDKQRRKEFPQLYKKHFFFNCISFHQLCSIFLLSFHFVKE